jgi:hypothetical protein
MAEVGNDYQTLSNPCGLDLALNMLDSRKKEISMSKGNCNSRCIMYQGLQHDTQFIKILCTIKLTKNFST